MKEYLVIFTENGARIEKDPTYISEHKNDINVLLNPELPHGVAPQYWRKVVDKIVIDSKSPFVPNKLVHVSHLYKQIKILKYSIITLILGIIIYVIFH